MPVSVVGVIESGNKKTLMITTSCRTAITNSAPAKRSESGPVVHHLDGKENGRKTKCMRLERRTDPAFQFWASDSADFS